MLSEKEVKGRIQELEKDNAHVLDVGPASVFINAPRALMQLSATSQLDALYRVIEVERPRFVCDDFDKMDE